MMTVYPDAEPGVRATGVVTAGAFGFLTFRSRVIGVEVQDAYLVIRLWFRTRRVPWQEIAEFRRGRADSVTPYHTLYVHLRDGSNIRVQTLSASANLRGGQIIIDEAVDRLEKERNCRCSRPEIERED